MENNRNDLVERFRSCRCARKRTHDSLEEEDLSEDVLEEEGTRALRTQTASMTPSDGPTFTISVQDLGSINVSSNIVPERVLRAVRNRLADWNKRLKSKPGFNWAVVQPNATGRSCIEARFEKKKSQWDNGLQYACAACEQRTRLCMVVDNASRVLLLPRKIAESEGHGPTEETYWRR